MDFLFSNLRGDTLSIYNLKLFTYPPIIPNTATDAPTAELPDIRLLKSPPPIEDIMYIPIMRQKPIRFSSVDPIISCDKVLKIM